MKAAMSSLSTKTTRQASWFRSNLSLSRSNQPCSVELPRRRLWLPGGEKRRKHPDKPKVQVQDPNHQLGQPVASEFSQPHPAHPASRRRRRPRAAVARAGTIGSGNAVPTSC